MKNESSHENKTQDETKPEVGQALSNLKLCLAQKPSMTLAPDYSLGQVLVLVAQHSFH